MWPVLFHVGPLYVYTISLFLVMALLSSSFAIWYRASRERYEDVSAVFDGWLQAVLVGVIASRIAYVALHAETFGLHPLRWIDIVGYPGVMPLAGVLVGAWWLARFANQRKWDAYEILDFGAIAACFGSLWIWAGAFFDGSSMGTPTTLPWGVQFAGLVEYRHPAQLYALLAYTIVLGILLWSELRYRFFGWYRGSKNTAKSGFLWIVYCLFLGIIGGGLLLVTPSQIVVFGVSLDWLVRLLLVLYAVVLLIIRSGRGWKRS